MQEMSWTMPRQESPESGEAAVEAIVTWVREAVATMRRPYGLDHVAVAFACRDSDGRVLCSNTLGVVRPAVFYSDEGAQRDDDGPGVQHRLSVIPNVHRP